MSALLFLVKIIFNCFKCVFNNKMGEAVNNKGHKISLFSAIMLALNSLIGSGWLFGSGSAAKIAGPAAILSWIIGAVIIIAIALTYVELGAMFP